VALKHHQTNKQKNSHTELHLNVMEQMFWLW